MSRTDPHGNPLPPRMHWKFNAYYRVEHNTWRRLDADYARALREWARLEGALESARTVAQMMEAYLVERGPALAEKTRREYSYSRDRLLPVFGACLLDEVTRQDIRAYLHKRSAAVAANRDVAFLRAAYSYAFECGWVEDNPAKGVRRRTEAPRRRVIESGDTQALGDVLPPLWDALLRVARLSGMRPGELRELHRDQLGLYGIDLVRPKTGAASLITWTPALVEAVRDALDAGRGSPWVFPSKFGAPYTVAAFSRQWARYCARAGIEELQLRDTRRTAATDADDLTHARDLLGHSTERVTARVYRVRNKVRALDGPGRS